MALIDAASHSPRAEADSRPLLAVCPQAHMLYTPDISEVVKEILSQPGWAPGNNLAILIELIKLEPKYQELVRERSILDNRLRALTVREGEERLKREVTQSDFENIQVLEPARPPAHGQRHRSRAERAYPHRFC